MTNVISSHDFSIYLHELLQAKAQQQIEPLRILVAQYQGVLAHFPHLQDEVDKLLTPQTGRDYALVAVAFKQGLQDLEKLLNGLIKAHDDQILSVVEVDDITALAELFNSRIAQQVLQKTSTARRRQAERQKQKNTSEEVATKTELHTEVVVPSVSHLATAIKQSTESSTTINQEERMFNKLDSQFSGWQKIGASGESLSVLADSWCAVIDEKSQLMWAINHNLAEKYPNCSDLTWFNANLQGAEGFVNQGKNTGDWLAYVNTKGWCGFYDWRLPTLAELKSLLTTEVSRYYHIREDVFTDMQSLGSRFWTSTVDNKSKEYAWAMYFGYGHDGLAHKSYTLNVRLVRDVN